MIRIFKMCDLRKLLRLTVMIAVFLPVLAQDSTEDGGDTEESQPEVVQGQEPTESVQQEEPPAQGQEPTESVQQEEPPAQGQEPTESVQQEEPPAQGQEPTESVQQEVTPSAEGEEASSEVSSLSSVLSVTAPFFSDGSVTYARSKTKIKLSASDPISNVKKIEYKIDEASEYTPYTEPIQITDEGAHQIDYRSFDIAGNTELKNIVTVIIDDTPPVVSSLPSVPFIQVHGKSFISKQKQEPTLTLISVDEYSGIKGIEYSVNGAGYQLYKGPISLSMPGDKRILFRSMDNLGNLSEPSEINVSIDSVAPTLEINLENQVVEHEGKSYSLKNNKFVISSTDKESGVASIHFKLDGAESFQPYVGPITLLIEGNHTIEAKSVDRAGNETKIMKKTVIVDIAPPQSSLEFLK